MREVEAEEVEVEALRVDVLEKLGLTNGVFDCKPAILGMMEERRSGVVW